MDVIIFISLNEFSKPTAKLIEVSNVAWQL